MVSSLQSLFKSPYNRQKPLFALWRFAQWKFIRLLKRKNVLYNAWGDRKIYVNYDSFHSMWLMYNYIVDWEEFNLIKNFVRPGDVVADIGANMGFYSLWMSKFTSGSAAVHSFEPDEENFQRLQQNIRINKLGHTIIANKTAIGDADGKISFTKGLDGENHIAGSGTQNIVEVNITTLDKYSQASNVSELKYCKIDVEGFEMSVLKGASGLLTGKKISILQLEINSASNNSGCSIAGLLELLQSFGYLLCCFDAGANSLKPIAYSSTRENYFAVADIQKANSILQQNTRVAH